MYYVVKTYQYFIKNTTEMLLAYSVTLYTSLYVHVFYKELTITIT